MIAALAAVLLGVAAGAPPARAAPGEPAAGRDQVIVGLSQEPDTLNPLFAEMAASLAIMATVFTSDVQRDRTGRLFAQGVTALPSVRAGTWRITGETMTLIWRLRPRRWHDGRPVTCGDYVFAHTVARTEQVPVVVRDLTNRIANVSCPAGAAGLDVRVTWRERYPHANAVVTEYGALPRHVLEAVYRRNPARLNAAAFGAEPSATVGDGPYRLVEWVKGSALTVEAVPGHPVFGTPRIGRITWRIIPDTNVLAASLLAGTIDAIGTIGISVEQARQLERVGAGRVTVFYEPGLIWEHIDLNLDNPLLQDVRVRRALMHGIDRDLIVQQLFGPRDVVAHSYLPPQHPGFSDRVPRYPYDPAAARALLEAAGFAPGPDGVVRDAHGRRLSLELATTAGNRSREQVAQVIQQQLRSLGVEIIPRAMPARAFFGEVTGRRRFPAMAMYAWVLSPLADCAQLYTSAAVPTEANGWAGQNYPGYRSAEMDRLCRAASRELDPDRRAALLADTAALFARDLPALPLYFRVEVAAAKPGLRNFGALHLDNVYETWNAARWFWQ